MNILLYKTKVYGAQIHETFLNTGKEKVKYLGVGLGQLK